MTKYPNLKSLNTFYKPYRFSMFLFIVISILGGLATLLLPFISSQLIINLTGEKYKAMTQFALLFAGLFILNMAIEHLRCYYIYKITRNLFFDIRHKVAKESLRMNLSSIYNHGSGFFMERMGEDSRDASRVKMEIYVSTIDILVNLGFIFYITVLNFWLGLIFACGLFVLVVLEYIRVSKMIKNRKLIKRSVEKVKSTETEIFKGIKEIKGIGAGQSIIEKHTRIIKEHNRMGYKGDMINQNLRSATMVVKALTDLAVLLFAGLFLLPRGQVQLAAVLVIYTYKGNLYGLVATMARIKDARANGELAAKRINEILHAPENETDNFGDKTLNININSIELKNVCFSYNNDKQILNNINLKINKPGIYGFVGKSGSGKSTIFSLLTNFYKSSNGEILFNDEQSTNLSERYIRDNITPVLQDPYMFNDTIMNNIRFARPDATDEQIFTACTKARIHDEILSMPNGYETIIGEDGATISGGQKQRLEIARAILKDTAVMLFDEATSALDKNNLNHINDLLFELGRDKIILVIAHRLGVMKKCDQVVVLHEGELIAQGTHEKLLTTCEIYAELFKKNSNTEETK